MFFFHVTISVRELVPLVMSLSQQKILSLPARQEAAGFYALAFLGIATVGLIDYVTGIEVRVFPLYAFPTA